MTVPILEGNHTESRPAGNTRVVNDPISNTPNNNLRHLAFLNKLRQPVYTFLPIEPPSTSTMINATPEKTQIPTMVMEQS